MSIKRIFHDPIHKEIVFDSGKPEELMIMELIDTVAFQRLRRIKQLGSASLPVSYTHLTLPTNDVV